MSDKAALMYRVVCVCCLLCLLHSSVLKIENMLACLLGTSVLDGHTHCSMLICLQCSDNSSSIQTQSQPLTVQTIALICSAHMQIQDVVLEVSQHDQSGGDGCSILHSGRVNVSREPQPNQLVQHQQALHQLQQHISKQHCLTANDLQQLLVKVCSSCCMSTNQAIRLVAIIFLQDMVVSTTVPGCCNGRCNTWHPV